MARLLPMCFVLSVPITRQSEETTSQLDTLGEVGTPGTREQAASTASQRPGTAGMARRCSLNSYVFLGTIALMACNTSKESNPVKRSPAALDGIHGPREPLTPESVAEFAGVRLPPHATDLAIGTVPHSEFGTIYQLEFVIPEGDVERWCQDNVNYLRALPSPEEKRKELGVTVLSLKSEQMCRSTRPGYYAIQREVLVSYPGPGEAHVHLAVYRMAR
jgi:hypothetical protein